MEMENSNRYLRVLFRSMLFARENGIVTISEDDFSRIRDKYNQGLNMAEIDTEVHENTD